MNEAHALARAQQPDLREVVDHAGRQLGLEPRHGRDVPELCLATHHRGGDEQRRGTLVDRRGPREGPFAHGGRWLRKLGAAGARVIGVGYSAQLLDHEQVAGTGFVHGLAGLIGGGEPALAHQPGRALERQRRQDVTAGGGTAGELRQQGREVGPGHRAQGEHHRHRQIVQALGQVEQELEACGIRQVGVVHRDEDRADRAEVHGQAVETVNDVEGGARHRPARRGVEQERDLARVV